MQWLYGDDAIDDKCRLDSGFWFGLGVFETIRVHAAPLFWEPHIVRLNAGLNALSIRPPVDAAELLAEIRSKGVRNCVLKIAVTADHVVFQTRTIPEEAKDYLLLPVEDTRSRNQLIIGNKTLNCLENVLARRQASENGCDDVLYIGKDNTLSETCRANLFWLRGGRFCTPAQSCGLLPGVVRQWVMDRFPVETGIFNFNDLLEADSVFVTNSVIGIRPVTRIGGRAIPVSARVLDMRSLYQSEISALDLA